MNREILVKAVNLTKKFGGLVAVKSVNFEIFKGESFGFLGPNGDDSSRLSTNRRKTNLGGDGCYRTW
jgi:ABC-type branched-subunit amino acid transport system ATPase component